jgi:hypothetical protein
MAPAHAPTTRYAVSPAAYSRRPAAVIIRQKFDFAAAHRLHTPSLSEEENRRIFGKCNNPSGHGHNYQVEPAVEVELDASAAPAVCAAQPRGCDDARDCRAV